MYCFKSRRLELMKQTLLVIDAQQELIEGNREQNPVYKKEQLIKTINKVIDRAQELGVPVTFVRDFGFESIIVRYYK